MTPRTKGGDFDGYHSDLCLHWEDRGCDCGLARAISEERAAVIAEVRAAVEEHHLPEYGKCACCSHVWPCPTIAALDRIGGAE